MSPLTQETCLSLRLGLPLASTNQSGQGKIESAIARTIENLERITTPEA